MATILNPATGDYLCDISYDDSDALQLAVGRARKAQLIWAESSFSVRAKHLMNIKKFLAQNAERASAIISSYVGKTRQDALISDILPSIMACDWYAKNAARVLAPEVLKSGSILFLNKKNTLEHIPMGVVGIISPWNYPFSIPFSEVLMGLMAGNGVILKVATQTTPVGSFLAECIEAGKLPAGLFAHIISPGADVGKAMLKAGVDKIFFTGSVNVGKEIMRLASETLTPVSLELGGNDPMIVLEDANIHRAVNCAIWAGFHNAGQSCGGVERVYVQKTIYEDFLNELINKTKSLRHGPDATCNVDIGAITTKKQLELVKQQVSRATEEGASIAAQSSPTGDLSSGFFFPATVIVNVHNGMSSLREEVFGPVIFVMPFSTVEEAISLANDCEYALTSSVFSSNRKKAREVAQKLESGVVTLNDHLYSHGLCEAPWGGWKSSGIGRSHGAIGLREMTHLRCINDDIFPRCHRNLWWFPNSLENYNISLSVVEFLSTSSFLRKIKLLFKLIKFSWSWVFTDWNP